MVTDFSIMAAVWMSRKKRIPPNKMVPAILPRQIKNSNADRRRSRPLNQSISGRERPDLEQMITKPVIFVSGHHSPLKGERGWA